MLGFDEVKPCIPSDGKNNPGSQKQGSHCFGVEEHGVKVEERVMGSETRVKTEVDHGYYMDEGEVLSK